MKNSGATLAFLLLSLFAVFILLFEDSKKISQPDYYNYISRHRAEERIYREMNQELAGESKEHRSWWEKREKARRPLDH